MMRRKIFFFLFILATLTTTHRDALAQETTQDRHTMVALRMVGHQILLRSGDRSSLVLPVEKEGDRYKLSFESPFQFEPDALVVLIDSIVKQSGIAKTYLVEVEACETQKVVYSYEMGISSGSDIVPCTGRVQPLACYILFFSILQPGNQFSNTLPLNSGSIASLHAAPRNLNLLSILLLVALVSIVTFFFYRQKKSSIKPVENPDLIAIGSFQFDKRNMTLSSNDQNIELTSKEADLLFLLHASANTTIEREVILNAVWGDEGDYAGRTLDVFISKLRKKLEADENLKIVNIRGIGYKMIVNETSPMP